MTRNLHLTLAILTLMVLSWFDCSNQYGVVGRGRNMISFYAEATKHFHKMYNICYQCLVNYFIILCISNKGVPLHLVISDLHELWKDIDEVLDVESCESNTQSFDDNDGKNELVVPNKNLVGKFEIVI